MSFVKSAFEDADIIIYMLETGDQGLNNKMFFEKLKSIHIPIILLLNKIDLASQELINKEINKWKLIFPKADIFPISALNKFNLENVKNRIIELLPESPPYYDKDSITDKSIRFLIQEIIREKILKHYKKEVPYSVQIEVEEFVENDDIVKIRAIIYVMRESQKGILIGHKGMGLKRIGKEARKDIENMIHKHVYLETPIKVKKNWRDDIKQLKRFGY